MPPDEGCGRVVFIHRYRMFKLMSGRAKFIFYPMPVLALEYCRRLHPCVRMFVCQPQVVCPCDNSSPGQTSNLGQRCKTPWLPLRCLLVWEAIGLDIQSQSKIERQILPHFELDDVITHYRLKLRFPNLDKKKS